MTEKMEKSNMDENQYQLELYRSSSLGGVYTVAVNDEVTLLYGNDLYFELHECAPDELLHKSCLALVHPEDKKSVGNAIAEALKNGVKSASFDFRIITHNGKIKHVLGSGSFNIRNSQKVFDGYLTDVTKLKQVEQALRESEEKFRIATQNADIAFWSYDFTKKEISQTDSSMKMHGFERIVHNVPESLIESGHVRQDSVEEFLEMYQMLEAGAETASGEIWFKSIKNEGWWCEHINYTSVFDSNGNPIRAYAVGIDVTARKIAEAQYNEEISYKNAVQSENLIASARVDLTSGKIEETDSKYPEISSEYQGKSYDACIDAVAAHFIDDEQKAEFLSNAKTDALIKGYLKGKTQYNFQVHRLMPDGTYHWVSTHIKLLRKPDSQHITVFLYSFDIDREKKFQQILEKTAHNNYDLIGSINLSTGSYELFSNQREKAFPELSENSFESAITTFLSYRMNAQQCEDVLRQVSLSVVQKELEDTEMYTVECTMQDEDGEEKRKQLRFSYIDKHSKLILYTQSDITEIINREKKHQEALYDALTAAQQANKAKTEFLSRMSHEIRTPMNAIIGMSALAAQVIHDPDQISDCLSKIGISARFLLSLINDILDMSRIESGKVSVRQEKIYFEEFLNGIDALCYAQAQEKGVEYESIITSFTESYYIGDFMKLQQVLINIIGNAIKFTPSGGKVQLIISQEKKENNYVQMKFIINDTGIGINENFMNQLFEPFAQQHIGSTTMYGGTGLGLAICKNLVELMGGKINVNSIEGVGTEFAIELKLGIDEESRLNSTKKSKMHLEQMQVLVVDDDLVVCHYTEQILKDMGLKTEYVTSGTEAIGRVKALWRQKSYYDIILVDWKMPDMDGIETTQELRKIVGPDVTIIIMTAYDWSAIEKDAKSAGVNLLISKPLFRDSISSAFEKIYQGNQNDEIPKKQESYDFTGKRVLLVEDHMLNIEVAKRLLASKNLEVDVAENGLLAIETFVSSPVGYYDVILMDIRMPVMDGILATQSIRQMRKEDAKTVPIIAMTANAFDEDIEQTKAAGMNAHIAKPIEPELLFKTLDGFLKKY